MKILIIYFLGTLMGVSGGLVANILHNALLKFSLSYYITAPIIFIFVLLTAYLYTNYKNNITIKSNKTLGAFLTHIKNKK